MVEGAWQHRVTSPDYDGGHTTMSEGITIGGHGARIELNVQGYERENASILSDANWLSCLLNFEIGPIAGATKLSMETHDLKSFKAQLDQLVRADRTRAELSPIEEVFQCTITMGTLGHALVSGVIKTGDTVKVELSFSFDSDQSFLRQTSIELEAAIEKFAVKS